MVTTRFALKPIAFPFFLPVSAGNGYIEGKELENFFQELEKARKGSGMVSPAPPSSRPSQPQHHPSTPGAPTAGPDTVL